jgi:hypothetical protein
MLVDHFRCHPAIIGFCNEAIYGGKLVVHRSPTCSEVPCPISIVWYEGDYREGIWLKAADEEDPNKKSRATSVNRKQMTILWREELSRIKQYAAEGKSICMLSPYRGQIALLKGVVKQALLQLKVSVEYESTDGEEADYGRDRIYALTIHKSQGQEFDVVYLLPVEDGNWEWPWSQGRRLVNVAASRAKGELRVILSTKLMEKGTQKRLTGGRVARVKKPAKSSDDVNDQEMYVRKLVEYTWNYIERLSDDERRIQDAHEEFGFRRSSVRSIFDEIPYLQKSGRKSDSTPEKCVGRALGRIERPGLSFAHNVSFDKLLLGDDPLSKRCEGGYECPGEAHFDFVVFDALSRRVVLAIEVDGSWHRFKKSKGHPDLSQQDMDKRKNLVASGVCGGTLARLAQSRQWPTLERESDFPGVNDLDSPQGGEGIDKSFVWRKSDVPDTSAFVFLRIPSDGTTYGETNELSNEISSTRKTGHPPLTIEDYIDKQSLIMESQGNAWDGLTVADDVPAEPMGEASKDVGGVGQIDVGGASTTNVGRKRPPGYLTISGVLDSLRRDERLDMLLGDLNARALNEKLLKLGYQELTGDKRQNRVPTEKGRTIGMLDETYKRDDGTELLFPIYSPGAQGFIRDHLEEILGA